jgi:hypothetical protein
MTYINFKFASRGISVIATIICFGGVASFIKSDTVSNKALALNIIIGSGAIAVGNQLLSKHYQGIGNDQVTPIIQDKDRKIDLATKDLQQLNEKHQKQSSVLAEVKALNESQATQIKAKDETIQLLKVQSNQLKNELISKVAEVDRKLHEDDKRFSQLLSEFKQSLASDLSERIYRTYNALQGSIDAKLASNDYQAVHLQLESFSQKLVNSYNGHCELLTTIPYINGDYQEIIKGSVDVYSQISDEIAALKVRYRNLLNTDERLSLELACQRLEGSLPKAKAKELLDKYHDGSKSDLEGLLSKVDEHQNSLQEMREQVSDLLNQIDIKNLEIADLNNQILAMKQPNLWKLAQASNELTKGNMIINYFWSKGLRLDRAFTVGDVYESKIYFHTDNNPRTIIFKELNEHSESLQQLCLTQKPVAFDWDADKGLMVASLVWKIKQKEQTDELSDEAINRLARSWDTWKKHAKKWNRIRITGGSGAGKSPLTERIVSEQLRFKKVKGLDNIKLYNPQAGSRKDHWSFPSIGKTHQDSIRGVAELTRLCSRRHQGDFAVWIFDEVDSTLRQAPGKKRPTVDEPEPEPAMSSNMLSIITQIDHTSQAVFYLGQGANTGKIPNTTKGDWNNLVAIHINGNAQDYLRLAEHIDKDTQAKLIQQAELLQKYCNRKNSELGLERVDPGAYRYALIDEYGEKQYYVLLPLFTADEFLDSLSANTQKDSFSNIIDAENVETLEVSVKREIKCHHCGSENFKKHSRVNDARKYRYLCSNIECKKTFVAEILTNSN